MQSVSGHRSTKANKLVYYSGQSISAFKFLILKYQLLAVVEITSQVQEFLAPQQNNKTHEEFNSTRLNAHNFLCPLLLSEKAAVSHVNCCYLNAMV